MILGPKIPNIKENYEIRCIYFTCYETTDSKEVSRLIQILSYSEK